MTRVAVVDIGTNSTRLLIADVEGGTVTALERRSTVTRLGEGLEASGRLGEAPRARVLAALDAYAQVMADRHVEVRVGVLTSAVRDAANGADFRARVRAYGIDADTISGDEEARLTFAGATVDRDPDGVLVVDIGGGSTELVAADWHVSTQVGVVRHGERHGDDVDAIRADVGPTLRAALGDRRPRRVVAVAGTATQAAAMDLALDPYDADAVEGHVLTAAALRDRLARLAAVDLEQRIRTVGLDPERAPTIVAGLTILTEILDATATAQVEVSDRDLLYGRALQAGS